MAGIRDLDLQKDIPLGGRLFKKEIPQTRSVGKATSSGTSEPHRRSRLSWRVTVTPQEVVPLLVYDKPFGELCLQTNQYWFQREKHSISGISLGEVRRSL